MSANLCARRRIHGGETELAVHQVDADRRGIEQRLELRRALLDVSANPRQLERPVHPRHELSRREGLDQIVVGARGESLDARLFAGPRRQQNARNVRRGRIGAKLPQQRESIQAGHHHVGQHQVGPFATRGLESRLPVGHRVNVPAARAKQTRDVVAHVGVVVGDENSATAVGDGATRRFVAVRVARRLLPRRQPAQRLFDEGRRGRRRGQTLSLVAEPVRRQMRMSERNANGESRPYCFLARDLDRSIVETDQLLNQRQTDSTPLVRSRPNLRDAIESLEEIRNLVRRNADSRVANNQLGVRRVGPQRYRDLSFEGVLERIRDEVEDDLLPHLAVHVHGLTDGRRVDDEGETRRVDCRLEVRRELPRRLRQIGLFVEHLDAPRLDAGEVEKGVHEPLQPQRVAVNHLDAPAIGRRDLRVGEHLLGGTEQQRERRAELVTHVREERGLRPVQLGERFGAPFLVLVRSRVHHRRRNLPGDELEERRVLLVEAVARAHSRHEHAARTVRDVRRDRHHDACVRRVRPRAGRNVGEARAEMFDDVQRLSLERLANRPSDRIGRRVAEVDRLRAHHTASLRSRHPGESHALPVRVEQVDQGERNVSGVLRQDVRGGGARLLGRPRFHDRLRAEVSQCEHTSLADDLFGGLGDRRDDAADAPVGGRVGHRTVRDREVRFFGEPVPLHLEEDVVHPRRWSAVEGRVDQRSDDVVDLPPALADGLPHRLRMLGAQDRTVRVVVQLDVVRAPPQQNRESVGQEEADHRLERLRPRLDGAERRAGPIDGSHVRTHLTAAREDVGGAGFGQLSGRHDVPRFDVGELVYRLSLHASAFPFSAPVVSRFPGSNRGDPPGELGKTRA